MIRAVIDTNVVVSAALVRHGFPAAVLDLVFAGDIVPCVSAKVLAEYEEVLARPRIRVDGSRARAIRETIAKVAIVVEPRMSLDVCTDPDTRDFPSRYKDTVVVTPKGFVEMWRKLHEPSQEPGPTGKM
jgi:putative PIN family toxin of toxin-antitoxin system